MESATVRVCLVVAVTLIVCACSTAASNDDLKSGRSHERGQQIPLRIRSQAAATNHRGNATNDGAYGVDVSDYTSQDSFQCMSNYGVSFAIVRCYQSLGRPDPNCPATVANAWAAGLAHVDIYMFPDTSQDPSQQVQDLAQFVSDNGIQIGMLWIDIEVEAWSSDPEWNVNFISQLLSTAQSAGIGSGIGVYTNKYMWETITSNTDSIGGDLALWYAHYDADPSFDDWEQFGGWSQPSIKQYNGDATLCDASVDINWYPM